MPQLPKTNYLSISEASQFLGVSIDTIRRWDKAGRISSVRLDGKNRYFSLDELKLLKENKPLTISKAAEKMGVSVSTLRRLEKRTEVKADRNERGERVYSQDIMSTLQNLRGSQKESEVIIDEKAKSTVPSLVEKPVSEESFASYTPEPLVIQAPVTSIQVESGNVTPAEAPQPLEPIGVSDLIHQINPVRKDFYPYYKRLGRAAGVLVVILLLSFAGIVALSVSNHNKSEQKIAAMAMDQRKNSLGQVLEAATKKLTGNIGFNIPAVFNDLVTFKQPVTFDANVKLNNKDLDAGQGRVFASNLQYKLASGSGVILTGGTNPTISNGGVLSLQGLTGAITLTSGTGVSITGTTITNTDTGSSQDIFKTVKVGSDTFSAGSNTDTLELAAGSGVSLSADTTNKKVIISSSSPDSGWTDDGTTVRLTTGSDNVGIGTNTASERLTVNGNVSVSGSFLIGGDTISDFTGNGLSVSANTLNINLTNSGTTGTTSSNSGLEVSSSGLSLLRGCSNNQILKWDSTSALWTCAADQGGTTGVVNIAEGSTVYPGIDTIQFDTLDFNATTSGTQANITIDYPNSHIARTNQNETISGAWTFSNTSGVTFSGNGAGLTFSGTGNHDVTASSGTLRVGASTLLGAITANNQSITGINTADFGSGNVSINGTTIGLTSDTNLLSLASNALTVNGTITAATTGTINGINISSGTVSNVTNLTINSGGDLTIGSVGLNNAGTNNTNSGATLIGVFDEFNNSNSNTLQAVLKDFDSAIGSGASKFTASGSVLYPNNISDRLGIGTQTAGNVPYSLYVTHDLASGATGKAVAVFNQTENQDILSASSSGVTKFTIASNGNITATGSLTGLTTLNASGVVTFGNYTTNGGLLYTNGSGAISQTGAGTTGTILHGGATPSYGPVALGSEVSGTLLPGNGGTGVATFGGTNTILYTTSADTLSSIATANNGVLITGGTGIPSIGSTLPNAVQDNITRLGTISSGIWNGTAISSQFGGTGQNFSSSTGVPSLSSGVWSVNGTLATSLGGLGADVTAAGAGELLYSSGTTSYGHLAAGNNGDILVSGGAGAPSWSSIATLGLTNYWNFNNGALSPKYAQTSDLLLGNSATSSAKFAILNISSGVPTASISANSGNNATYLTGNGTFGTTNAQTLTVGGNTTGNVIIDSGTGNITLSNATIVSGNLTLASSLILNSQQFNSLTGNGLTLSSNALTVNLTSSGSTGSTQSNSGLEVGASGLTLLKGCTDNELLTWDATNSVWKCNTVSGVGAGGDITAVGSMTSGAAFADSSANGQWLGLGASAGRVEFDDQTIDTVAILSARLGVGTNTPEGELHVTRSLTEPVTGKALAIFDQNENQDILTASASGTTRLTLDNTGNLNIVGGAYKIGGSSVLSSTTLGSSVVNSSLTSVGTIATGVWQGTVIGATYGGTGLNTSSSTGVPYISGGTWSVDANSLGVTHGGTGTTTAFTPGSIVFAGGSGIYSQDNNNLFYDNTNKLLGIGTSTPISMLQLTRPLTLPATGKALAIFNQNENQDIFSASASGTTRLTLSNSGNLNLIGGVYQSGGVSGITQGSASCVTTTGGIVTGFGTCQLGTEQWVVSNGALYPNYNTYDFFIGGSATSSAKFAVLNTSSGTPVASVSSGLNGNGAYLTASGDLASTNMQTLTLGGGTTGNISLSNLTFANAGLTVASGQNLTLAGITGNNAVLYATNTTGVVTSASTNSDGLCLMSSSSTNNPSWQSCPGSGSGASKFTLSGNVIYPNGINQLLGIGTQTAGNVTSSLYVTHDLASGATGKAVAVFDQTENQDILTASASGITVFELDRNGGLVLGKANSKTGSLTFADASNGFTTLFQNSASQTQNVTYTLPVDDGTNNYVLSTDGSGVLSWKSVTGVGGGTGTITAVGNISSGEAFTSGTPGSQLYFATNGFLGLGSNAGRIAFNDQTIDDVSVLSANFGIGTGSPISRLDLTESVTDPFTGKALAIFDQPESQDIFTASSSGTTKFTLANNGNIQFAGGSSFMNTLTTTATAARTYTFPDQDGTVCLSTSTGCIPGTTNYWQVANGALSPIYSTPDLLIGSTASNSAKFAVLNVGSGTPVASVSSGLNGNGAYLTASGDLASTNMQTLTLGGGTTGNISLSNLTFANAGLTVASGQNLTLAGITGNNAVLYATNTTGVVTSASTNSDGLCLMSSSSTNNPSWQSCPGSGSGASKFTLSGNVIYPNGINQLLGIGTQTAGNVTSSLYVTHDLASGATGKAVAVFDQTENQDILTASASGTTRLTLDNSGNLTIVGGVYKIGGSSVLSSTTLGASVVNSSLTSVGTIGTGIWQGTRIAAGFGGTGIDTSTSTGVPYISGGTWSVDANSLGVTHGGTGTTTSFTQGSVVFAGVSGVYSQDNANLFYDGTNHLLGLGTATPVSEFQVTRPLTLPVTGKALAIFNQNENQSILVGSASGALKFAFDQNGNLGLSGSNPSSSNYITASNFSVTTGGAGTFSTLNTGHGNNELYAMDQDVTTTSGVTFDSLTATTSLLTNGNTIGLNYDASANNVLSFGAGPGSATGDLYWGDKLLCSASTTNCGWATSAGAVQYWSLSNNAIYPIGPYTGVADLLLGSTATSSAKFAVLNIAGGTPTASLSAGTNGGAYLTADGTLATTAMQNLTLGAIGTQNIFLAPNGTTAMSILRNGKVGIGTSSPVQQLEVNGTIRSSDGSFVADLIGNTGGPRLNFGDTTDDASLFAIGAYNGTNNLDTKGRDLRIYSTADTTGLTYTNATGLLGIGTTSPISELQVTRPLTLPVTGKALAIFNQNENQDILTGSASGTTKFVFDNSGNLNIVGGAYKIGGTTVLSSTTLGSGVTTSSLTTVGTIGTGVWQGTRVAPGFGGTGIDTSGSTGVPSINSGTWSVNATLATSLGGLGADVTAAGAGELLYSTGATTYGHLAAGTSGQILSSGGTGVPSWVDPNTGRFGLWDQGNGALYPKYASTVDLLLGGTATSSAKFGFLNVNSGTPTATIAGNLSIAVPTGSNPSDTFNILNGGSLNFQTSLGGDAGLGSRLYIGNNGNIGIGTTNPSFPLHISKSDSTSAGVQYRVENTSTSGNSTALMSLAANNATVVAKYVADGLGTDVIGTPGVEIGSFTNHPLAFLTNNTERVRITNTGTVGIGTTDPTFGATTTTKLAIVTTDGGTGLAIGNSTTPRFALNINGNGSWTEFDYSAGSYKAGITQELGLVGLGTTSPVAQLHVAGAYGSNAAAIINQLNSGDILTASASGTTKFTVDNSGRLFLASTTAPSSTTGMLYNNGGNINWNGQGICLADSTNCPAGSGNFWQINNGAISPIYSGLDLLLGSTATSSAKFAVLNISGGTPTASISAGTNGGLSVQGNGTFNALNGNSLNFKTSVGGDAGLVSRLTLGNDGSVLPGGDITQNFGSASNRWWDIYAQNITGAPGSSFTFNGGDHTNFTSNYDVFQAGNIAGAIQIGDGNVNWFSMNMQKDTGGVTTYTFGNQRNGQESFATAANSTYTLAAFSPPTGVTLTGSTTITSQQDTVLVNPISFQDASAVTMNNASSLTIAGAPIAQGSVTIGNSYGFKINAGSVAIGGTVNNAYGLFVDAPTGGTNNYAAIFNTGNVGIGTTSPISQLHVTRSLTQAVTGKALAIFDQNESQDILTGSASGTTKFIINHSGYIGINMPTTGMAALQINTTSDCTTPWIVLGASSTNYCALTAPVKIAQNSSGNTYMELHGTSGTLDYTESGIGTESNGQNVSVSAGLTATLTLYGGASEALQTTNGPITFSNGSEIARFGASGNLGLGTTSPLSQLHVTRPVTESALGKALAIFDQNESQDILTGSASGSTKFVFDNAGNLTLGLAGTTQGGLKLANTSSNIVTFASSNSTTGAYTFTLPVSGGTNGYILSTNGSGVTSWLDPGTLPSSNYWDQINGTLTPKIETQDLLLGGNASSSAKFAVLNMNSGTPVASISALTNGGTYLTADGTLATTAMQNLTLGAVGTQNISFAPNGTTAMTILRNGNVGIGTTAPGDFLTIQSPNSGTTSTNNLFAVKDNGGVDKLNLGTDSTGGAISFNNGAVNLDASGLTAGSGGGAIGITTGQSNDLTLTGGIASGKGIAFVIGGAGAGAQTEMARINNNGYFGLGTSTPATELNVTRSLTLPVTGEALAIFNQQESQDILTASASGATKFTVDNSGRLFLASTTAPTTTTGMLYNNGGNINWNGQGICLANSTNCPAGSGNFWQINNGAISPIYSGLDLLLGSTATSSAKFGLLNVSGGTPTASISANSGNNGVYLTGSGNLATTNSQTLTLGGSSTGQIVLSPLNNQTGAKVMPGADNTVSLGASSSARFKDLFLGPGSLHVQCTTGDGCGQNLDYAMGVNTGTNAFYLGVNGISGALNQYLTVMEGGNVGIGTGTPAQKLTVVGGNIGIDNSSNIMAKNTGGSYVPLLNIGNDNYVNLFSGSSSTGINLMSSNLSNVLAVMKDNGTFGLGTTSPIAELHVNRSLALASTGKALAIFDQPESQDILTASAGGSTKFVIGNTGNIKSVASAVWEPLSNSTTALGIANAAGTKFVTYDTTNQLVGIGATPSNSKLYIDTGTSANDMITANEGISTNNNYFNMLRGGSQIQYIDASGYAAVSGTAGAPSFKFQSDASTGIYSVGTSQLGFSTGGALKLTIDSSGNLISKGGAKWMPDANSTTALQIANAGGTAFVDYDTTNSRVGIGTTSPSDALQVAGTIRNTATSGTLPTSATGSVNSTSTTGSALQVVGRYGYVFHAGSATGALESFDLSNPASPVSISRANTSTASLGSEMVVAGRYAYLTEWTGRKFEIFDVSNPSSMTSVFTSGTILASTTHPSAVFVQGKYLYITTYDASVTADNVLLIYDISNPTNPIQMSSTALNTGAASGLFSIFVKDRYAYAMGSIDNNLYIYDIANPTNPIQQSATNITGSAGAGIGVTTEGKSMYVEGGYLYYIQDAGTSTGHLVVLNVKNPTSIPAAVASVATNITSPTSVVVSGRYVYVAENKSDQTGTKVEVFDASVPASTASIGTITTSSGVVDLAVSGKYLYTITNNATHTNLQVFELPGIETTSLFAHSAELGSLQVDTNAIINNGLMVNGGLNVGQGGIYSNDGLGTNGQLRVDGRITGQALSVFNETGNQAIFTASASGSTKFTITNGGNIQSVAGAIWQPLSDSTSALGIATSTGTAFVNFDTTNQKVGIGTTSPISAFHLTHPATAPATGKALAIFDQIENQDIFTASQSGITRLKIAGNGQIIATASSTTNNAFVFTGNNVTSGNVMRLNADGLTTGTGLSLSSASTALSSGSLMAVDWSPTSSTVATGDLLSLNIGANGIIGNIFNVKDNGSSVFSVSQTAVTSNIPVNFTSPGDVAMAYDLNFTNPTASYINSSAPLYLRAGEVFNSSNLTLQTYNNGNIIFDSKYVMVGTGSAQAKFYVEDNQSATVSAMITNTNAGPNAKGLAIKLGYTGAGNTGNHFLEFLDANGITKGSIQSNGSNGIQLAQNGIADLAEYMKKDGISTYDYGMIMCIAETGAVPCSSSSQEIAGVMSDTAAVVGGDSTNAIPVGVTGMVRTQVSTENGPIKAGDYITISSTPGVGMKATGVSEVVGRAVEDYDGSSIDRIKVLVSPKHYDPTVYLTDDGNIAQPTDSLFTNSVESDTLLNKYITKDDNYSTLVNKVNVLGQKVSQLETQVQTATSSAFIGPVASDSATEQLTGDVNTLKETVASNSGQISSITSDFDLINSRVTVLESELSTASMSAEMALGQTNSASASSDMFANVDTLNLNNLLVGKNLTVLGRTVVNDLGVTGNISAGILSINGLNGEINTVGDTLKLQPEDLAGIEAMGGKFRIDTNGTVTTQGAVIAESVLTKQLQTDLLTVTANQVATDSAGLALDTTQTSTESALLSSSAGQISLKAGLKSYDVRTTALTPTSLIFATPDQPIAIGTKKKNSTTFTITIPSAQKADLKINWWIVDTK